MNRYCFRTFILLIAIVFHFPALARGEEDLPTKLAAAHVEQCVQSPGYADCPAWRNGELHFASNGFWHLLTAGPVKIFEMNPSGSALRQNQDLVVCDSNLKLLLNLSDQGKLSVLAEQFDGKPLNSLNDVTIDAQGRIYWSDPVGSSREKPVGSVFRVDSAGIVTQIIQGLAYPAGLEVDPSGKFLYVVESQTHRVLKYDLPADATPPGAATPFFDVGGSGADGCACDKTGNLWLADFHQKEPGRGRLTVVSPEGALIGHVEIPAKVVSNVCFGGANLDEIYCTTAEPPGVFRVKAGVQGFEGHRAPNVKVLRELDAQMLSSLYYVPSRKMSRLEKKLQRQLKSNALHSSAAMRMVAPWTILQTLQSSGELSIPDQWKGRNASNRQAAQ